MCNFSSDHGNAKKKKKDTIHFSPFKLAKVKQLGNLVFSEVYIKKSPQTIHGNIYQDNHLWWGQPDNTCWNVKMYSSLWPSNNTSRILSRYAHRYAQGYVSIHSLHILMTN